MPIFAQALIELGLSFVPSVQVNVENALPCCNTVRSGLLPLSKQMQKDFKTKLPLILELRGASPAMV